MHEGDETGELRLFLIQITSIPFSISWQRCISLPRVVNAISEAVDASLLLYIFSTSLGLILLVLIPIVILSNKIASLTSIKG